MSAEQTFGNYCRGISIDSNSSDFYRSDVVSVCRAVCIALSQYLNALSASSGVTVCTAVLLLYDFCLLPNFAVCVDV